MGYFGESVAAEFLRKKGYEILASNFTVRGGEIDLVARQGEILVFVEVKTRMQKYFGDGDESLDRKKKKRLWYAMERYLNRHAATQDPDYRVDLVEIEIDEKKNSTVITHFEDIEIE